METLSSTVNLKYIRFHKKNKMDEPPPNIIVITSLVFTNLWKILM